MLGCIGGVSIFSRMFPLYVFCAFVFTTSSVSAQMTCDDPVVDGFEVSNPTQFPKPDKKFWYLKQLVENQYWFDPATRSGGDLSFALSGQIPFIGRNEIRLRPNCQPRYGLPSWYRFNFHVSGYMPKTRSIRHIIGQWKESTGCSPFVAQRLDNGIFHISITTEIRKPGHKVKCRKGTHLELKTRECRIIIAKAPGDYNKLFAATLAKRGNAISGCPDLDLLEDLKLKVTAHKAPCRGEQSGAPACLPNPFSKWVEMEYLIKGGNIADEEDGAGGRLEVYADGDKIVTVEGAIGHLFRNETEQYFKMGVYRDIAAEDEEKRTTLLLERAKKSARLGRKTSRIIVFFDDFRHGTLR